MSKSLIDFETYDFHLGLGQQCAMVGNDNLAINYFSVAIKTWPYLDAFFYRGMAYYRLKDYRNAVYDFTAAIIDHGGTKNPLYLKSMFYRGLTYGMINKTDFAINDFNELIRLDIDNSSGLIGPSYRFIGLIYSDAHFYARALNYLKQALDHGDMEAKESYNDLARYLHQNTI